MELIIYVLLVLMSHVASWRPLPRVNHIMYGRRRIQTNTAKRHMFSGIVEEMGTVEDINFTTKMKMWDGTIGEGVELTIRAAVAVEEAYIGCSIAVNGVCLTATAYDVTKVRRIIHIVVVLYTLCSCTVYLHCLPQFTVGLAPETLRRSNLGQLVAGSRVNLERALKADSRNSGHFVQGHVDCTGEIVDKWREMESLWVKVKVPQDVISYIVPKGFICVDGTSLTICEVDTRPEASWFTFMLVAHTQQSVIIPSKALGDMVNIEVDVLAKMVERSLAGVYDGNRSSSNQKGGEGALNDEIADLKARVQVLENIIERLAR